MTTINVCVCTDCGMPVALGDSRKCASIEHGADLVVDHFIDVDTVMEPVVDAILALEGLHGIWAGMPMAERMARAENELRGLFDVLDPQAER